MASQPDTPKPPPPYPLTEIYVVTHYVKNQLGRFNVQGPRNSFFVLADAVQHVKEAALVISYREQRRGIFQKEIEFDLFRWTDGPNYYISVHAEKVDHGKNHLASNLKFLRENAPAQAEKLEAWKQEAIKNGDL